MRLLLFAKGPLLGKYPSGQQGYTYIGVVWKDITRYIHIIHILDISIYTSAVDVPIAEYTDN